MQYCQLQYMIKILLLNGLFVLFSHAMEQGVVTNIDLTNSNFFEDTLSILSLPSNRLMDHLSKLSDQPPVFADCPTVSTSQSLGITTPFLLNYDCTFKPFPNNTGDFGNSRSDNTNGMPPRPLNQNFCSLTDSYGKQKTKKRQKDQQYYKNCGRARKRTRTNLTPQEKAKKKLDRNRRAAQKFRARLQDAIGDILRETNVVGERDTGLNNALVVIRRGKCEYNNLLKQLKKQKSQSIELQKKSCELKGLLYGIQLATPNYELKKYIGNFVGIPEKFNITEHAMDDMPYDNYNWPPLLLNIRLEDSSVQRVFNLIKYSSVSTDSPKLNQSDDKNCEKEKRTRKDLTLKKLTFQGNRREKNRISAQQSRARLNDAIKAITKETDIVCDGAIGLKNALVVIRSRKCKYRILLKQLKEQKSQYIELQREYFEQQNFLNDILFTTSNKQSVKLILDT